MQICGPSLWVPEPELSSGAVRGIDNIKTHLEWNYTLASQPITAGQHSSSLHLIGLVCHLPLLYRASHYIFDLSYYLCIKLCADVRFGVHYLSERLRVDFFTFSPPSLLEWTLSSPSLLPLFLYLSPLSLSHFLSPFNLACQFTH